MNTDLDIAIKSAVSDIVAAAPDVIDDPTAVTITPTSAATQRRLLPAAAAVLVVAAGVTGIALANRGSPSSNSPAAAERPVGAPLTASPSEATLAPAGFPRLRLPDPSSPTDRRLAGAQDYPIEGGWFSFQNYTQELDLNHDGTPTPRGTFSIAIFTGTPADADRAACSKTPEVIDQGGRTIWIYERGQEARRFIWNETPGVYVVVDTQLIDRSEGLAAIGSLEAVNEDDWAQHLSTLPSADIVTTPDGSDPEGSDSIWWYYTTDQPVEPATTIPGESTQPSTALC